MVLALIARFTERGAHRRRGGEIEAAAKFENQRTAAIFGLEIDAQLVVGHGRGPFSPWLGIALMDGSRNEAARVVVPARDVLVRQVDAADPAIDDVFVEPVGIARENPSPEDRRNKPP